ncbi:MAG: hypothetical protein ACXWRA_07380 [Pseudobdellovibrionaceae bacterium]
MRFVFTLILCFNISGCMPQSVKNPAAKAPTYQHKDFKNEIQDIFQGNAVKNSGLKLETDIFSIFQGTETENFVILDRIKSVAIPDKIDSTDQAQLYIGKVQKEIDRIDAFLTKYSEGPFRLRYEDGDLKVENLSEETIQKVKQLRQVWTDALEKLKASQESTVVKTIKPTDNDE